MRKIIILTLLALCSFSCQKEKDKNCNYIDNYYQTVYLAEEAYHKKDFEKVVALMKKAESNCELLNQPIIYETLKYAESAAHLGKNKKAFELIRKLILKGDKITYVKDVDAFKNIVNTNQWLELEKDYDSLRNEYLSSINLELREKIREMSRLDQIYNSKNNFGKKLSDSMDVINEKELKKIIAEYGYPNETLIGDFKIDFTAVGIKTMLYHFDDYDYWTITLKELIKKGQAPPDHLGGFVDSYQRRFPQKKKYIYGIYNNASEKNIIEYDKLDERRISIGLPPMKMKRALDSLRNIQ